MTASFPVKERQLISRKKAITNPLYGKRPEERTITERIKYGLVNLDKPSGPTSHEVTSWVKRILEINKAGHGGTLDPKVTGVLPVALEETTKVIKVIQPAGKEYVCLMRLHVKTPEDDIRKVFKEFETRIIQRPPVKSAVKRQLRTREVYEMDILEIKESFVLFRVSCEAGTYIRKLCHDMGEVLGCGANMQELRRTRAGTLTENGLVSLHDLQDAYIFYKEDGIEDHLKDMIITVEEIVSHLPKIVIYDGAVDAICHGANLAIPGIAKVDSEMAEGDTVAIFTLKGELVAIGTLDLPTTKILSEKKGIAVLTKRVLMEPGTYPKNWKTQREPEDG